jgi:hypothetical protein
MMVKSQIGGIIGTVIQHSGNRRETVPSMQGVRDRPAPRFQSLALAICPNVSIHLCPSQSLFHCCQRTGDLHGVEHFSPRRDGEPQRGIICPISDMKGRHCRTNGYRSHSGGEQVTIHVHSSGHACAWKSVVGWSMEMCPDC